MRWFNDADVLRNLAMHAPMSDASEAAWFDRMLAAQGTTDYHFVICRLSDARPIGTIGLHGLDLRNGSAEFGIAIGEKTEWNKGQGTDALRAICDFGFGELRLERISLTVYANNERARRAYEKAGFVHEGTLRRAPPDRVRRVRKSRASRGYGCILRLSRRICAVGSRKCTKRSPGGWQHSLRPSGSAPTGSWTSGSSTVGPTRHLRWRGGW